jgi:hypothetical protein
MGWKDIFSKRRNAGRMAPLTRAPRDAAEVLAAQAAEAVAILRRYRPEGLPTTQFIMGYLTGYAAQGADASERDAKHAVGSALGFSDDALPKPDAAGVLLGRHEAQCGTAHLLELALDCAAGHTEPDDLITACDTAADRLQSHEPQRNFRFTAEERALLRETLKPVIA